MSTPLTVCTALDGYFAEALDGTLIRIGARLEPEVRTYVVLLLRQESIKQLPPTEPLAPRLAEALGSHLSYHQRREKFRVIGDASLVSCGLWWMWHERTRRADALDFYLDAGRFAYRQLDVVPLFGELAGAFGLLVDVLARMELTGSPGSMADVLRLFRIWERTHSDHAARILLERGINVFCPATPS